MQQAADGAAREEHARAASGPWWVQQGYPPFEEDEAGWPHAGQVVRYFRQRKRRPDGKCWTQADLARALGISERAVRNMEERKEGLDSISRRRFLAETLAIPPVLLGLAEMPGSGGVSAALREQVGPAVITRRAVDPEAAAQRLEALYHTHWRQTAVARLAEAKQMMSLLYEALPWARSDQPKLASLLAQYHLLSGEVLRDQQCFQEAEEHFAKAVRWAQHLDDVALLGVALERRITNWYDAHDLRGSRDAEEARSLLRRLPPLVQAGLLIRLGVFEAWVAAQQGKVAWSSVARCFDQAITLLSHGSLEPVYHLRVDLTRCLVDRGAALIGMGWNKEALAVLPAESPTEETGPRRQHAYAAILMAQAYANLGQYEMSVMLAQEAIPAVQQLQSAVNLARLKCLTDQLAASPFGSAPEVARLRALLAGPRRGKPGPQSV
ncbi:MAG: helix-turn-helix transcriptional regulator [Thermogemmatispora sp.]|uniref:helix-turn-helix domain-containing protein n=2 Tax=Thermogemmatispora sp. TaxID=1968838 RepID=UPI001DA30CD1|nr:helix-turn-helix transcriptional regulator [Thermogemmatispora sp.]MBX5451967.1 helix-turn-helix transcriptional regulator [Thermogemmatispora sp.]